MRDLAETFGNFDEFLTRSAAVIERRYRRSTSPYAESWGWTCGAAEQKVVGDLAERVAFPLMLSTPKNAIRTE